jgi:hypothetical protein
MNTETVKQVRAWSDAWARMLERERDKLADRVVAVEQRVALLLCERHQDASPTRIPCAACSQDARDAIASETGA